MFKEHSIEEQERGDYASKSTPVQNKNTGPWTEEHFA